MHLQIDLLALLDIQKVKRRAAAVDHVEGGGVGWVVEAVQRAVVDAEAVAPQMQLAVHTWRRSATCRGDGLDDLGRGIVAAECLTSTGEVGCTWLFVFVATRTGGISGSIIRPKPLHNVMWMGT